MSVQRTWHVDLIGGHYRVVDQFGGYGLGRYDDRALAQADADQRNAA